jgi:hypothetical protein
MNKVLRKIFGLVMEVEEEWTTLYNMTLYIICCSVIHVILL